MKWKVIKNKITRATNMWHCWSDSMLPCLGSYIILVVECQGVRHPSLYGAWHRRTTRTNTACWQIPLYHAIPKSKREVPGVCVCICKNQHSPRFYGVTKYTIISFEHYVWHCARLLNLYWFLWDQLIFNIFFLLFLNYL